MRCKGVFLCSCDAKLKADLKARLTATPLRGTAQEAGAEEAEEAEGTALEARAAAKAEAAEAEAEVEVDEAEGGEQGGVERLRCACMEDACLSSSSDLPPHMDDDVDAR